MRLILLYLLVQGCASLQVLMYLNAIGRSHVQHAEKLIEVINGAGHQVDLIMGHMNKEVKLKGTYGARRVVINDYTARSKWNEDASHLVDPFKSVSQWNPLAEQNIAFYQGIEGMCDVMLRNTEIHTLLRTTKYDVIMTTAYESCPNALFYYYDQGPIVSFAATPAVEYQNYYAGLPELPLYGNNIFNTNFGDPRLFSQRLYNTLLSMNIRLTHARHIERMNAKLRIFFGPEFPDVREILRNNSLDFTNSHPLLEEPKPISFRSRYIGGIGLPEPKRVSEELDATLNLSSKGNVIFSFGTQVPADRFSSQLVQTFLRAFQNFPEYNFLWKFDGTTKFNVSNVHNLKWLPQTDLLYDPRVVGFISHMGLNSFLESSHAGVPILCIPLFADQIHNAKRAQHVGTGVIVPKDEITVDRLTDALAKILYDKSYLKKARELASMMEAHPERPQRVLLEGLEYASKFKNLHDHYTLEGAYHPFYVHAGWDVAIFLFVVVLLAAALGLFLTYKVLAMFRLTIRIKSKSA